MIPPAAPRDPRGMTASGPASPIMARVGDVTIPPFAIAGIFGIVGIFLNGANWKAGRTVMPSFFFSSHPNCTFFKASKRELTAPITVLIIPIIGFAIAVTTPFMPFQISFQLSRKKNIALSSAPPGRSHPSLELNTVSSFPMTVSNKDLIPFQTVSQVTLSAAVILSQFLIARTIPAIARATPIIMRPIGPIARFNAAIAVVWSQVAAVAIT